MRQHIANMITVFLRQWAVTRYSNQLQLSVAGFGQRKPERGGVMVQIVEFDAERRFPCSAFE
jgi:hypothetical protein